MHTEDYFRPTISHTILSTHTHEYQLNKNFYWMNSDISIFEIWRKIRADQVVFISDLLDILLK